MSASVDFLGRRFQVGPSPGELVGRDRAWMLRASWAAMAAIGILQYGFGSLVPSLVDRGWSALDVFWLLALWTVFQAGAGFPVAFLRERGRIGPRTAMIAGAVLLPLGPLSLAFGSQFAAVIGYSVLSGTGAGLVYATCSATVAKWYPERQAAKVSLATGAFAYGSVPFAIAFLFAPVGPALTVTAVVVFAVVLAAGSLMVDPPANWWPASVDPREWMLEQRSSAVRQYSPREAMRTGVAPLMYLILFIASAVSLFDITFLATLGGTINAPLVVVAVGTGVLLGANGAGRAAAIRVSDRLGRTRTLAWVLAVLGLGQLFLASAASTGAVAMLVFAALLAGVGGGAFYPLFASLVREFFGDQSAGARRTHAAVYSAKAFGGVLGVGVAAAVLPSWGYTPVLLLACALAVASAALCVKLRQPGRFLPGLPPQRVATTES
ncbi:MFS transporter [Actinophytocola algeriensis]|uniref:MFS family permease n=1 Tax=Actinophytocola algeriensis TaxID=1768010 RepID=A0A7W7VF13_9PSEU|nr:MFS transporter [Actinophytocola algeriensis]MBB4907831.1 MFS family permease [Actinophytocola algeriensis]MBE1479861.1 MFS family permease [Actinophytocola algeriensis]